jgi:hypothetical protein
MHTRARQVYNCQGTTLERMHWKSHCDANELSALHRRRHFSRAFSAVSILQSARQAKERLPVWHRSAQELSFIPRHLIYLYTCALDWCCGLAQLCCDFPFSCARLFTELHRRRVLFLLQLLHNCSRAGCVHLIAEPENCGDAPAYSLMPRCTRSETALLRSLGAAAFASSEG